MRELVLPCGTQLACIHSGQYSIHRWYGKIFELEFGVGYAARAFRIRSIAEITADVTKS